MEQAHAPKKKWIVIGILLLLVVIVAINLAVMQSKKKASMADLQFARVTEREISTTKLISGRIVPKNTESIYADSTKGKVKEIFVKEGQEVQKGQKLFSYENSDLSMQSKQLDIDKKSAQNQYDKQTESFNDLKKKLKMAEKAHAESSVIDQIKTQLEDIRSQRESTLLQMDKNKLQAEDLQNKQNDLIVYSHMKGIVQKVNKDAGQGTLQASGSEPVVQIASEGRYQVEGSLTELQKAQIKPHQPIKVIAKAVSNKTWKGKITEVGDYPTSDELVQSLTGSTGQQTQNISYYPFKASLDSQKGLSPGYHVSIQVKLLSKKMLAIPRSSIVDNEKSPFVYVVKANKLRKQKVTTGAGDGEWIEVLEGLKAGDTVVKNPSEKVYDGLEVEVK